MWAVLGPARPEEGTTCFRAGLGLYFYSLGWHGTARNFFGPSRPDPFWPEARWAWAVPARPGPIPSTTCACHLLPLSRRSSYTLAGILGWDVGEKKGAGGSYLGVNGDYAMW